MNKLCWVVVLAAILVSACAAPVSPTLTPTIEPTEASTQVLNIYNWDEYIDPQILTGFEEEFDVEINYQTFGDSEDMLAKVRAGPVPYDIVVPTDYVVEIMRREELLAPLDKDNIPNFENVDPLFLDPTYDPGNRYCAPYQWGTTGVGYNIQETGGEIQSWGDLFAPEFAGEVAWQNAVRDGLAPILIYLGYSPNTTDPDKIQEAADFLKEHSENIAAYTEDTADNMLAAGEVDLAQAWNGDIVGMMQDNTDIRYVIPKEGSTIWSDNMCILATAEHKALAEKFINYILDPEVGAVLSNYLHYPSPNKAAIPYLDEDDRNNPAMYPPEEIRSRLFFLSDVGASVMQTYEAAWAEVIEVHQR